MISLYPDQEELILEIRKAWPKHNRFVCQAATGFGKTRVSARIIEGCVKNGLRVCFVVPRISLIKQTADSFTELGLEGITFIWGEQETDHRAPITIASIDTMIRREKPDVDLFIIDEAHKRRAKLLEWMEEFPDDRYIGLSATPFYGWMGEYYTDLVKSKPQSWLIENGRLSPYEIYAPTVPDLSGVKTRMGEYVESDLEGVMGDYKVVGDIVQNWLEKGEDRLTMVLCVNCDHANFVTVEFSKAGVNTEVITAKTPIDERHRIFKRLRDGITKIIVSVDCLTEGFDEPKISCLINARPTKSMARWHQGFGRAIRYLPGKTAIIFDHSGTALELGDPCDYSIDELPSGGDGDSKDAPMKEKIDKPEKVPKKCPSCNYLKPAGVRSCPKCGFVPLVGEDVETDRSRGLEKLGGKKKEYTMIEKQRWLWQLQGYYNFQVNENGKSWKPGWVAAQYRSKFQVWPKGLMPGQTEPTPEVLNWLKSQRIKFAKSKNKANN